MPHISGKIVFSSGPVGEAQIWLYDLDSNQCLRISDGAANCFQPILSPGGVRVAFIKEDACGAKLQVIDLQGEVVQSTDFPNPSCSVKSPSFDPSGKRISYLSADGQAIWVQDLDSGICEHLCFDPPPTHSLRWSPQGSLYGASTNADGNTELWEFSFDSSGYKLLSTEAAFDTSITPAPEYSLVAFLSDRQLCSINTRRDRNSGRNALRLGKQNWARRQAAAECTDIWVMNSSGHLPVKITDVGHCAHCLAWSADGSQLLYTMEGQDRKVRFAMLPMSDLAQAYERNNKAAVINAADQLRSLSREHQPCLFNEDSLAAIRNAKSFHWHSPAFPTSSLPAVGQEQSFDSIPVLAGANRQSAMQMD
jgi:Tol biopolymer transport system component